MFCWLPVYWFFLISLLSTYLCSDTYTLLSFFLSFFFSFLLSVFLSLSRSVSLFLFLSLVRSLVWSISQLFHYVLEAIVNAFNVVVFPFQYSTNDIENKVTMILDHLCCIRWALVFSLSFHVFLLVHLLSCYYTHYFNHQAELKGEGNEILEKILICTKIIFD